MGPPQKNGTKRWVRPALKKKSSDADLLETLNSLNRLMCMAIRGPPPSPEYSVVAIDGDPTNSRSSNLRWQTDFERAAEHIAARGVSSEDLKSDLAFAACLWLVPPPVTPLQHTLATEARIAGLDPARYCLVKHHRLLSRFFPGRSVDFKKRVELVDWLLDCVQAEYSRSAAGGGTDWARCPAPGGALPSADVFEGVVNVGWLGRVPTLEHAQRFRDTTVTLCSTRGVRACGAVDRGERCRIPGCLHLVSARAAKAKAKKATK